MRTIDYPPTRFLQDSNPTPLLSKAGEDRVEIIFRDYLRELGLELKLEFENVLVPRCAQPIDQVGQCQVKG